MCSPCMAEVSRMPHSQAVTERNVPSVDHIDRSNREGLIFASIPFTRHSQSERMFSIVLAKDDRRTGRPR
jgi:hypothetical protein